jgi:hypothetical protein
MPVSVVYLTTMAVKGQGKEVQSGPGLRVCEECEEGAVLFGKLYFVFNISRLMAFQGQ